jgi:putative hydroxymethylpyrimidine transport system substrate-binding protein
MKTFRLLLVGVAAALLLAGCGEGESDTAGGEPPPTSEQRGDLKKLQLSMEGYASPPDAGILLADRLGYFADAGLNLTIIGSVDPTATVGYAAEGASDVVVVQTPEVVQAQAEGKPVVMIGSVMSASAMAMIWLPESGIDGIADLEGKTIAHPGAPYQAKFLEQVLKSAGLTPVDVKLKDVRGNSAYALADGRADAAFAPWNTVAAALESRGLEPVVTKAADLGIPAYEELVLTTRPDSFAKDPELYRSILEAISRGAVAAEEDPEAGSQAIVDKTLELAPPKPTLAGVEATAPLLSKTGEINQVKLRRLVGWMHEQGMIERKVPVTRLIAGGKAGAEKTASARRRLRMTLNSRPGPETAGVMLAERRGYFRQVGLDPLITHPASPSLPITYAANGATDVIVTQEPELALAQDEGFSLVAFGSLVPHPTMAMIWLEGSGIESVADLRGKTIAYPGVAAQKDFLELLLATAGLELTDIELEAVGYNLAPVLERGRADAVFGGSASVEGASLEGRGLKPVVTPVTETGVPGYDELVFAARPSLLAEDPTLSRRILRAISRGNAAVKRDPATGYRAVVDSQLETAKLKDMQASVEATAPLLSATGEIDAERVSGLVEWMHEQGMLEREIPASQLIAG